LYIGVVLGDSKIAGPPALLNYFWHGEASVSANSTWPWVNAVPLQLEKQQKTPSFRMGFSAINIHLNKT